MAVINAADVAKLRRVTLAGMMDCKKALEESEGNFDKAIEIIRKKGQAVANKRADKEATEGVVLSKTSLMEKRELLSSLTVKLILLQKMLIFWLLPTKFLISLAQRNLQILKNLNHFHWMAVK